LVRLNVDVIVTWFTPTAVAARQATRDIPIVMAETGDPIGTGLIASLPRPGGNVTGIASVTAELAGKSVQYIVLDDASDTSRAVQNTRKLIDEDHVDAIIGSTVTPVARFFQEMGFKLFATRGTASYLRARGIPVSSVFKVHEGRPNCLDMIVNGDVELLINTPLGKHAQWDDYTLRQAAIRQRIAYTTTMSAARAASDAILSLKSRRPSVRSLQEWQQDILDAAAVEV